MVRLTTTVTVTKCDELLQMTTYKYTELKESNSTKDTLHQSVLFHHNTPMMLMSKKTPPTTVQALAAEEEPE